MTGSPQTSTVRDEALARLLRRRAVGELWLPVHGSSMAPTIVSGSQVRVEAAERPRGGEIWAVCTPGGRLVVHRVAGRVRDRWLLRGDASPQWDRLVPATALVGRVVAVARADGSIRPVRRGRRVRSALGAVRRRVGERVA